MEAKTKRKYQYWKDGWGLQYPEVGTTEIETLEPEPQGIHRGKCGGWHYGVNPCATCSLMEGK